MYERILVTIDFSEPSVAALRWTAQQFPDAAITLFHSIERLKPPAYLQQVLESEKEFQLERELDVRANLELLAVESGIEPRIAVHTGLPRREVHLAAEEADSEIIVVGAHTRRIWPQSAPGNISSKIANRATRPVLVWRSATSHTGSTESTVLAALDLRGGSEPVARMAAQHAGRLDTRLLLLHVLSPTLQAYLRAVSTPTMVQEAFQQVEQAARQEALAQLPDELRGDLEVQAMVVRGRPVTQILTAAENEAVDLIVMGQRQTPTGTGRMFLGRVTETVLREANCSVLVIPL